MEGGKLHPLVVEWSPRHVRLYNPISRKVTVGASMAEVFDAGLESREAIIAISQRSAFIRSTYLPGVSRSEIAKILEFKVADLLPIPKSECVYGFRIGPEVAGKGRLILVGAVKTESLRKISVEAKELGLRIKAIVPVAFGSWLAAKEKSLSECIVVEEDVGAVHMDVIHEGEICYSRSVPMPDSADELQDEVARTFTISEISPSPVLSTGCPGVHSEWTYAKEAVEYLSDLSLIKKQIFSLELPEAVEIRAAREERMRAFRAITTAAAAIALGAFAYTTRITETPKAEANAGKTRTLLNAAKSQISSSQKRLADARKANRILDVAFSPGQSLSDVVTVLSQSASQDSWFTNVTLTRWAPMSISGLAMTDGDVAKFSAGLAASPRFKEMKVVSLSKASIGKRQVTQFLLLGKVAGLLAFDRPPKVEKQSKRGKSA